MNEFKKTIYYIVTGLLYFLVLVSVLGLSFVLNNIVNKGKTIYAPGKIEYTQTQKATPKI